MLCVGRSQHMSLHVFRPAIPLKLVVRPGRQIDTVKAPVDSNPGYEALRHWHIVTWTTVRM